MDKKILLGVIAVFVIILLLYFLMKKHYNYISIGGGKYLILNNGYPASVTTDKDKATPIIIKDMVDENEIGLTGGGKNIFTLDGNYINLAQNSPTANLTLPGTNIVQESNTFTAQLTPVATMYIPKGQTTIAFLYASGYYFLVEDAQGFHVSSSSVGAVNISIV